MIKSDKTNNDWEHPFSKQEIESLVKTRQDFIDGKTTALDWDEIEEELNRIYN